MSERIANYPSENSVGLNCEFWDEHGCGFPKAEMMGRMSCEGIVDPVCIYLKNGKKTPGFDLTEKQIVELNTTVPDLNGRNFSIPPSKPIELK